MSFTINDDVTLTSSASIDNVRISGNTISSTNTDGHIVLAPNGNGTVQTDNLQFDGNTISSTDTDGHIVLAPNGNGNVGIGTSSPSASLHVVGNVQVDNLALDGNALSSTTGDIVLMPSVNVGIGTSNTDSKLHVAGDINLDAYESGEGHGIFFRNNFHANNNPYNVSITVKDWGGGTTPDGLLVSSISGIGFHTNSNTYDASKLRMLIVSNGNVGIGTSSPQTRLDLDSTGITGLRVMGEAGSSNAQATFRDSTYGISIITNNAINTRYALWTQSSAGTILYAGNSGNVGIGTSSPRTSLHVGDVVDNSYYSGTSGNIMEVYGTASTVPPGYSNGDNTATFFVSSTTDYARNVGASIGLGGRSYPWGGGAKPHIMYAKISGVQDHSLDTYYGHFVIETMGNNGQMREKFRITGDGNVGIGTATPTAPLSFPSTTTPKISLWRGSSTTQMYGFGISTNQLNYHVFHTNADHVFYADGTNGDGTELMRIKGDGNVGIGTSSPAAKLDIAGSYMNSKALQLRSGDTSTNTDSSQIIFSYDNGSYDNAGYSHSIRTRHNGSSSGGNAIDFWLWDHSVDTSTTLGSLRVMTLEGTGNVGIGTNNPNAKLDIGGNTDGNIQAILARGYDPNMQLQAINSSSSNVSGAVVSKFGLRHGTNEGSMLHFIRGNGAADGSLAIVTNNAEQVRVDSAGNVGIGTTSPAQTLDVNGSITHKGLVLSEGTTPNVDEVKTFNLNVSYDTTSWTDVGINTSDLATGSYIIQLYLDNGSQYVANRATYYTGFMSWYGGSDIYQDPATYNEILLHHSGRAQWNGSVFYLRTYRNGTAATMSLQIKNAARVATNVSMTFKFRRMI